MSPEFTKALRERFSPRRKYLIGVSGGRDSVALLHLLHGAGYQKLVVCHFNHGLRGRESGQDAVFVRRLANKLGYPFETAKVSVRAVAAKEKLSLETAARQCRHEFFARMARRHRCFRLFLGHHADDQVETILMNLCRGAGLRGLSGMGEETEHRIGQTTLAVLRPFLSVRREAISAFVEESGIAYREDSSNAETDGFTRNRVRHQVIPLLNDVFRRETAISIQRLGEIARSEVATMDWWFGEQWEELTDEAGGLRVSRLRELPAGLRRRVIGEWLKREKVPGCGFAEVKVIDSLVPTGAVVAKVNLPGGRFVRRNRGRIFLET